MAAEENLDLELRNELALAFINDLWTTVEQAQQRLDEIVESLVQLQELLNEGEDGQLILTMRGE